MTEGALALLSTTSSVLTSAPSFPSDPAEGPGLRLASPAPGVVGGEGSARAPVSPSHSFLNRGYSVCVTQQHTPAPCPW